MAIPAPQREVAQFLTTLSGAPPRETHISAIFVGQDTVWKLKKAVRMPFLDFTALEARHHYLSRELDLNKPAAPCIYRDIVPVARQPDGSLVLGGADAVDWVLRMARVPEDDFLDVIVARGRLTPALLRDLGDCVFALHARLPPITGWDSVASMHRIADGNLTSARAAALPEARISAWREAVGAEITRTADILRQRATHGAVRRCHGDLHLGNMCLWQGKPVAFDALEFDEDLATIDVGYDLAFLLMDVDLKAGRSAANQVMNRYIARGGDTGVLAPMQLFLSQRAFIRAHVFKATGDEAAAQRHLDAAEAYLRPGSRPRVIAIGGLQGTGKSTLARMLAPELGPAPGALVVRSDEVRKRLFGALPEQSLDAEAYTDRSNCRTNAAVVSQAAEAARQGHTVIVDSTFLAPGMRESLEQAVALSGIPFTGIWLEAPLPILEQRIRSRRNDASDATVAVLRKAAERGIGRGQWAGVDAARGVPIDAVRQLLALDRA